MKSPVKDVLIAGGVVVGLLAVLGLYTGNWPPVVVVESNSMMHVDVGEYRGRTGTTRSDQTNYGRFGTIDPGDLVLVKEVGKSKDVRTWAEGGRDHYGKPGDVIVYRPDGGQGTPIIHRAMTFVWVRDVGGVKAYIVKWSPQWTEPDGAACTPQNSGNYTCTFSQDSGVTIAALSVRGMKPLHSGFVTKGDDDATNTAADMVLFVSDDPRTPWSENLRDKPIPITWIDGVARGEIPWFGLIKLALSGGGDAGCGGVKNCEMAPHPYYIQVGNVVAPKDLWVMLFVGLLVVTVAPVLFDVAMAYRQRSERKKGTDWTLLEGTAKADKPAAAAGESDGQPPPP